MELTPIFVTGIIFLALYKTIELFVRRKERIMVIEKLSSENARLINPASLSEIFGSNPSNSFSPLRWGCLAAGLGVGMLAYSVVFLILDLNKLHVSWSFQYPFSGSLILLGGGIGLLIAYSVEKNSSVKHSPDKKSTLAGEA